jgi:hypothetical protein
MDPAEAALAMIAQRVGAVAIHYVVAADAEGRFKEMQANSSPEIRNAASFWVLQYSRVDRCSPAAPPCRVVLATSLLGAIMTALEERPHGPDAKVI